ncbi:MAG TPA: hypothetical protein VMA77_12490 [Solirubrobacteraceae bacterium]|nr:hypothetical protein [Solirubrobacteraceae bacterium]
MQSAVRPEVREFFERYERAGRELDLEAVTSSFADTFLSLDATSAHTLTPHALISALPKRKALFERIGSDGMELGDIEETPLDDGHTLVRTSWTLRIPGGSLRRQIALSSTFLLRRQEGAWRIVVYLNHQDMGKVLGS